MNSLFAPVIRGLSKVVGRAASFLCSRSFLAPALGMIVADVSYRVLRATRMQWNDVRLIPTFSFVSGYDLYALPDSGPILNTVYGPVAAVAYLPAALFSTPTGAILCGSLLSVLFVLLPAFLLLREVRHGVGSHLFVLLCCVVYFHLRFSPAIEFSDIHVDPPTMGLCLLAWWFALRHGGRPGFSLYLAGAAVCASLAPWAKQSSAPVAAAIFLYFLLAAERGTAWRYLVSVAVASIALLSAAVAAFGRENLEFTLLEIPLRQPSIFHKWGWYEPLVEDFMDMAVVATVAVIALMVRGSGRSPDTSSSESVRNAAWPYFLLTALAVVPLAVPAFLVVGGALNNFLFIDLFLTLAVAGWFMSVLSDPSALEDGGMLEGAKLVLALLLVAQIGRAVPDVVQLRGLIPTYDQGVSARAHRFALQHPQSIYLPWNPLASLMADGELYHVGYGVVDRELAGIPISEQHYRRHLPSWLEYVAFKHGYGIEPNLFPRFPEFRCRVEFDDMPDWQIYTSLVST